MQLTRPQDMFGREHEWRDLSDFGTADGAGARLGVVSGRRRQGKTFLLYALAQSTGGFYYAATEATATESLRRLGHELGEYLRTPAPLEFTGWDQAVDALLALGRDRPVVAVLDEFPYLARAVPELPSIVQRALTPGRPEREDSRTRLLLCGSALSFMGGLLSGTAPLRGRASLELSVRPLDFREAGRFWGAEDPRLAARLYSVVGGTPAYRREYVADDVPASGDDFDDWVVRTVLNPSNPLFREARYLLAEEPDLRDPALYHSVLAAVVAGNHGRGGIANYIGRKATDLQHPLTVLEDAGLVAHDLDPLRRGQGSFRVTEPLVAFYQAVMRPSWARLERRRAAEVWAGSGPRFTSAVLGPAFEELCRNWLRDHTSDDLLDAPVGTVGRSTVSDPAGRVVHEIDVVALGEPDGQRRRVLALGEAKWGEPMEVRHLDRLRRIRELIADRRDLDADAARLVCFGAGGFGPALVDAGRRGEAVLVDLARLYGLPASDR